MEENKQLIEILEIIAQSLVCLNQCEQLKKTRGQYDWRDQTLLKEYNEKYHKERNK